MLFGVQVEDEDFLGDRNFVLVDAVVPGAELEGFVLLVDAVVPEAELEGFVSDAVVPEAELKIFVVDAVVPEAELVGVSLANAVFPVVELLENRGEAFVFDVIDREELAAEVEARALEGRKEAHPDRSKLSRASTGILCMGV